MSSLKNKVVIVTGAAGGIGLASVKKFIAEGAKVLMVGRNENNLKQAFEKVASDNASYIVSDVSKTEDTKAYIAKAVELYGGIDVLFSNAGVKGNAAPLYQLSEENYDLTMNINTKGVFLGLKYVIPEMLKRGKGSIIITSSIAGLKGTPMFADYTASKHAVIGLMKSCVQEVSSQGIRINCINPGPLADNNMTDDFAVQCGEGNAELFKEQVKNMVPMGRFGTNQEVANLVAFLASDESGFCNGASFSVDGGMSAV